MNKNKKKVENTWGYDTFANNFEQQIMYTPRNLEQQVVNTPESLNSRLNNSRLNELDPFDEEEINNGRRINYEESPEIRRAGGATARNETQAERNLK